MLSLLDNDDRHPKGRSYGYDSKAGYGNYGNYQGIKNMNMNVPVIMGVE